MIWVGYSFISRSSDRYNFISLRATQKWHSISVTKPNYNWYSWSENPVHGHKIFVWIQPATYDVISLNFLLRIPIYVRCRTHCATYHKFQINGMKCMNRVKMFKIVITRWIRFSETIFRSYFLIVRANVMLVYMFVWYLSLALPGFTFYSILLQPV